MDEVKKIVTALVKKKKKSFRGYQPILNNVLDLE